MSQRNVLYRFFDGNGVLLYVGISMTPWERFRQHRSCKEWWDDIRDVKMEPYPSRAHVLAAEKAAIQAEHPLHNVVHNGLRSVPSRGERDGLYGVCVDRCGNERRGDFRLVYEVSCDPISDNFTPKDVTAHELMRIWLETYYEDKDWAPISWYVDGPGIFESASCSNYWWFEDRCEWFGDFYTPILDAKTGAHVPIESLPVEKKRWSKRGASKGGFIAEATGWTPRPLQREVRIGLLENRLARRRAS